jgi:hypothetical protein
VLAAAAGRHVVARAGALALADDRRARVRPLRAVGGDLGAIVSAGLGRDHADVCAGILVQAVFGPTGLDEPTLADDERRFLEARRAWATAEGAYAHQQATRPRTLAYGLADSPAGLLAWLLATEIRAFFAGIR